MELKTVTIEKPEDMNFILGHSHFIKTVEDVYEAMVNAVPFAKFGIAFCEASGPCLVRYTGTDDERGNPNARPRTFACVAVGLGSKKEEIEEHHGRGKKQSEMKRGALRLPA